jgi:YesN/AraC family two-component response regulator
LIVITGHGDIDMAVSAIKAGALDFIEKPIDDRRLASGIAEAARRNRNELEEHRQCAGLAKRYTELSDRQRQVMDLAVQGPIKQGDCCTTGYQPANRRALSPIRHGANAGDQVHRSRSNGDTT